MATVAKFSAASFEVVHFQLEIKSVHSSQLGMALLVEKALFVLVLCQNFATKLRRKQTYFQNANIHTLNIQTSTTRNAMNSLLLFDLISLRILDHFAFFINQVVDI
jgi:hypothetical protein